MADIFLLKYQARPSEMSEGVAFFGRAGAALMKSCQRLKIDPLQLYGTNVVKCGGVQAEAAESRCLDHLRRELATVSPRVIVGMGEEAVGALNRLEVPLSRVIEFRPGALVEFSPGTEVLMTPDIDASLDEQRLKVEFWHAFRRLGEWYEAIPPY
jgi:uracil-DNA glycosylase family 4